MNKLLSKNWVFISGLLASLAVALQQFIVPGPVEWKAVGYAAMMAVLSYLANQWRGQGVSFTGIVGTLAYTFVTISSAGTFSWGQFILSGIVAVLSAVAPPAKPVGK